MHDSKIRSRLKAQLTKFCVELCVGLSRPLEKFACQMLFGIQASQDVKLSNIARSLQEQISQIETGYVFPARRRGLPGDAWLSPDVSIPGEVIFKVSIIRGN